MQKIITYRDLIAWQKAMDLAELVYRATEHFPRREHYGLALEMRRSAVSIPSNIAEGKSQRDRPYRRHLIIAIGSHAELHTQSELAGRLGYLMNPFRSALDELLGETGRLTQGLLNSTRQFLIS